MPSFPATAGVICTTNPATPTITATIPATAINTVGSPVDRYLTGWFYGPSSGYSNLYAGCTAKSTVASQMRITLPLAGGNIDGYPIFKTNIDGVGIIFKSRDRSSEPGKPVNSDWTQVAQGATTYWDASFGARLVSTSQTIASGTVSGLGVVGQLRIVDTSDIAGSSTIIPINVAVNGSVTLTSKTCSVSADSKNISIFLGHVNISEISSSGDTARQAAFRINFDSCAPDLNVYMTLTDNNDLGNSSDILSLIADGEQATGVGIRIVNLLTSQPVRFGLDSATPGNPNQFFVINTTTQKKISIPFIATYIKTGSAPLTAGSANGVATFTMSYQ